VQTPAEAPQWDLEVSTDHARVMRYTILLCHSSVHEIHHVMLCCVVLYYVMLYSVIFCYILLYSVIFCSVLFCSLLFSYLYHYHASQHM
jgi:hypothetical protein